MADDKTKSGDFRYIYSNSFTVHMGDNDCVILFGMDTDPTQPGRKIRDEVGVVLTPKSAKMFALGLLQAVEGLESIVGTISVPQSPPGTVTNTKSK